jgi:hypothetical protein
MPLSRSALSTLLLLALSLPDRSAGAQWRSPRPVSSSAPALPPPSRPSLAWDTMTRGEQDTPYARMVGLGLVGGAVGALLGREMGRGSIGGEVFAGIT